MRTPIRLRDIRASETRQSSPSSLHLKRSVLRRQPLCSTGRSDHLHAQVCARSKANLHANLLGRTHYRRSRSGSCRAEPKPEPVVRRDTRRPRGSRRSLNQQTGPRPSQRPARPRSPLSHPDHHPVQQVLTRRHRGHKALGHAASRSASTSRVCVRT